METGVVPKKLEGAIWAGAQLAVEQRSLRFVNDVTVQADQSSKKCNFV